MALSPNAVRALEQVKMGLYMLYGADYFTEDEWIKIDYLLHKGKYVLTSGPPRNFNHEEELISFGESKDDFGSISVQNDISLSFNQPEKEIIVTSEQRISSPNSSEESHFDRDETPNATSVEPSSDEDTFPNTSSHIIDASAFDNSEQTTIPGPSPPNPQTQTTRNLPPGITQEQLDEARTMQAGMTKAGQKSRPNYKRDEESLAASHWDAEMPEEITPDEISPSELDNRIDSWASNVSAQQASPSPITVSPVSISKTVDPKVLAEQEFIRIHGRKPHALAEYWQPSNLEHFSYRIASALVASPTPTPQTADPKSIAELEFIKAHGRKPKSVNDFYQPNNPAHFSQRPMSRASNVTTKTAKTTKTTKTIGPITKLSLKINPGSTYIAQSGQSKAHGADLKLEIHAGDHLTVFKFVSGVMWVGTNQSTKQTGQFSEAVFIKPSSPARIEATKPIRTAHARTLTSLVTSSLNHNSIENVEWTNAAEWDEAPARTAARPVAASPTPVRPMLGGLASSRYSVPAVKAPIPSKTSITLAMKQEFGKMVDEKVDEILKARGMAPTPAPSAPAGHSRPRILNETLKPVPPKKNTCWFWATNKGCRFTGEECRDLHGYLSTANGEPTNLHMGKPTWGSLADTSPTARHADPSSFTVPEVELMSHLSAEQKKSFTCWYWANHGKCDYTAENCKYLHEHSPKGVASRPWKKPLHWTSSTWRRDEKSQAEGLVSVGEDDNVPAWGEEDGAKSGELVLEEVRADDSMSIGEWGVIGDGGAGGWGRETPAQDSSHGWGQDDRYKPPHIKALEEKALIETVGW